MRQPGTHGAQRLLIRRGIALSLMSAALFAAVPIVFGSPQRAIEIQWRKVADSDRRDLERQLRLIDAARVRDNVWLYVPADTSRDTLRRIVSQASIEQVVGVDRRELTLTRSAPLTAAPRRPDCRIRRPGRHE